MPSRRSDAAVVVLPDAVDLLLEHRIDAKIACSLSIVCQGDGATGRGSRDLNTCHFCVARRVEELFTAAALLGIKTVGIVNLTGRNCADNEQRAAVELIFGRLPKFMQTRPLQRFTLEGTRFMI